MHFFVGYCVSAIADIRPPQGFRCYEISNNRYATANKTLPGLMGSATLR